MKFKNDAEIKFKQQNFKPCAEAQAVLFTTMQCSVKFNPFYKILNLTR